MGGKEESKARDGSHEMDAGMVWFQEGLIGLFSSGLVWSGLEWYTSSTTTTTTRASTIIAMDILYKKEAKTRKPEDRY